MTMTIQITIPEDDIKAGVADAYLSRAMSALGFSREIDEVLADAGPNYAAMKAAADAAVQPAEPVAEAVEETPAPTRAKPAPARGRKPKETAAEEPAAPAPAISTGEERIDPTTVEDAAQDEEDEAAEVEAAPAADLTHDDVRAALKGYLDTYGTAAAMEDGPKVLKMLFGDKALKVSDVPTDQASLAKAIAGIDEMRGKNPFSREPQL